ncbi:tetratricopeptide repeat protein [Aeromonas caviae]|uniref:tetratricopeptide repeat protein n=1 Tax=Aeromonas caviae TaxID=648 RepID=UPI001EEFAF63|nr:tetratricopeptide repeat protein [Aeromonas caviae]ULH03899.1 tetratricopeptide repeat protein [Aeromonas caviae]
MDNASQQYNVSDLAKFMRKAKDSNKPFVFFTGAGCSVTAGIPLAKKLIEEMHKHFETELKLLVGTDREDYGKCMAQIGRDDRRRFLKSYIDEAKINWAHIALACLLREGYIGRVLTFNFDNLLARSCGLLGLYPATYDFTAANLNLYHLIDNPAVVHLHGQSHGFAQLNSDKETAEHAAQLSQFVCATLNESPALFIGYSGQADAFFPQIKDHFSGQHRLFWVDMTEHAPPHVSDSILQTSLAYYMSCSDGADLFLIELAQQLDCFPPMIFTDPYAHQLEELEAVTSYPQRNASKTKTGEQSDGGRSTSTTTQDILQGLRQRLKQAQQREYDERRPNYLELYLQGKYKDIIKYSESVDHLDITEQVWVAKAYLDWALTQTDLEQELTVYDKLIERFGTSDIPELPELQEQVANALFNKGVTLGQLDRIEDEITVYEELIQHFNKSDMIEVQEQIALALFNKGVRLGQMNRLEDEITQYDTLIQRFNTSDIPALQEQVAKALLNKGFTLDRLGHSEDAISVYDELIRRFGTLDVPTQQEQVAKALFNKGVSLGQQNRLEDEITQYDELIQRFGTSDEAAVQKLVVQALLNKGIMLDQLGRPEDAITAYDELIQHFGSSDVLAIQEQVAKARHLKGLEQLRENENVHVSKK